MTQHIFNFESTQTVLLRYPVCPPPSPVTALFSFTNTRHYIVSQFFLSGSFHVLDKPQKLVFLLCVCLCIVCVCTRARVHAHMHVCVPAAHEEEHLIDYHGCDILLKPQKTCASSMCNKLKMSFVMDRDH